MAPFLFALALMMQDAPAADATPEASPDGPMATAIPRKQVAAPLPIQGGQISAPTDDYGYVAWCYGAISSYVELYDRAMPEVIRIERAWPTPSTEENISQVYPAQRDEGKRNLVLFARAMVAAERASPTPIQDQGIEGVRRGRAMWTGATSVPKAQLAQFWMSWSPPARCEETAKALEARSLLFGQALSYNAKGVTAAAPPPPAAGEPVSIPVTTPNGPAATLPDVPVTATTLAPHAVADATPPAAASESEPSGSASDDDVGVETTRPGEAGMVYAQPQPSEDPEVEVSGDDASSDPAAPGAEAADPATAVTAAAPSAIDALLPVGEPEAAAPVAAPPPVAAAPAEEPAKPPVRKHKRGLRETLSGMRGRQ